MGLAGSRIFAQNGRSVIHVALRDPGSGLPGSCRLHAPNALMGAYATWTGSDLLPEL